MSYDTPVSPMVGVSHILQNPSTPPGGTPWLLGDRSVLLGTFHDTQILPWGGVSHPLPSPLTLLCPVCSPEQRQPHGGPQGSPSGRPPLRPRAGLSS